MRHRIANFWSLLPIGIILSISTVLPLVIFTRCVCWRSQRQPGDVGREFSLLLMGLLGGGTFLKHSRNTHVAAAVYFMTTFGMRFTIGESGIGSAFATVLLKEGGSCTVFYSFSLFTLIATFRYKNRSNLEASYVCSGVEL